jgi:hypothetical protein
VGNKKLAIIHLGDWRQNKYPQQDISFSECSTIMENFQHTFTLCVCVCVCVCVCAHTCVFTDASHLKVGLCTNENIVSRKCISWTHSTECHSLVSPTLNTLRALPKPSCTVYFINKYWTAYVI